MIVPVMAISNLVLTRQIYSEETNGAHAPYREPVPLRQILQAFPFSPLLLLRLYFFALLFTSHPNPIPNPNPLS